MLLFWIIRSCCMSWALIDGHCLIVLIKQRCHKKSVSKQLKTMSFLVITLYTRNNGGMSDDCMYSNHVSLFLFIPLSPFCLNEKIQILHKMTLTRVIKIINIHVRQMDTSMWKRVNCSKGLGGFHTGLFKCTWNALETNLCVNGSFLRVLMGYSVLS